MLVSGSSTCWTGSGGRLLIELPAWVIRLVDVAGVELGAAPQVDPGAVWPPDPRDPVADQAALDDTVHKAAWSGTSIA